MQGERCFDYEEHTADVIVLAWGKTLERAFECAAEGVTEIMVDRSSLNEKDEKRIIVAGFDLENLLYRWIEEILFLFDSQRFLMKRAKIEKLVLDNDFYLEAELKGEIFDPKKHEQRTHVKAVTYSLMSIVKDNDLWKIKFTVDI
ncbi:MAG: archease [Fervidicoccaceae archaeon]